jgi:protein Tex
MKTETDPIIKLVSEELKLRPDAATRAIQLLDEGATVPFIARYRKEMTGGMDEDMLRKLEKSVNYHRQLTGRKSEVLESIAKQDKLTPELAANIEKALTLQEVEDLYLPFRPKRRTRATIAREKGLEPLADLIQAQKTFRGKPEEYAAKFINPEKGVTNTDEALAGARDIVAERISEDAEVRKTLRNLMRRHAVITSGLAKGAKDEAEKYRQYYEYSEPLAKIPAHRWLALSRGERENVLKVAVAMPVEIAERATNRFYPPDPRCIFNVALEEAMTDGLKRLVLPSVENEVRANITEEAEAEAIKIFAANLRQLLLTPPFQGKVIMGIDPGYRTGCKIAVVDPTGKPLANFPIYPHEPKNDLAGSKTLLLEAIRKFKIEVIAIGNGTASRETESLIAGIIAVCPAPKPAYVMVSEAGASVYSASDIARQEFPNLDATQRGNISIARRLQDPLAELVKIDPKSIGVGLYQHDVNQKTLAETLDAVVVSCVNFVGVDVNTASVALLKHVSGVNKKVAEQIVSYRETNGAFKERKQLNKVPGLGAKTFEQAAGFLKIPKGNNPLDNTFIHPESYEATVKLLKIINSTGKLPSPAELKEYRRNNLPNPAQISRLAGEIGVGVPTLEDILDNLEKPGRDPREELPKPILRQDVLKMEDLSAGMVLKGTVRNVVNFGAFVDIGVKQDGLVHVTEMSDKYIKDPLEVVGVGDIIDVRVLEVDVRRGRISLSMKGL